MKLIPLTQGKVAMVDDEDFERLASYCWHTVKRKNGFHAKRATSSAEGRRTVYLHTELLGTAKGKEVHHKNGNGLDNRRNNLVICSHANNAWGFQSKRKNASSLFRGVSWDHQTDKWRAKIVFKGITICLGRYGSENKAAAAYNTAAKEYFGGFAHLNPV